MCHVCEELDLHHGDVIVIDDVHNADVATDFRLHSGIRALILANDDYFQHMKDYITGDPKHMVVVTEKGEPFGVMVLYRKHVSWRKDRTVSPQMSNEARWQ